MGEKFALVGDVVIVDLNGVASELDREVASLSWRIEHKFEDGAFTVRGQDGAAFLVHDLKGLRHIDGDSIRPAFDARGCEGNGCERTTLGLCGRFGE